MRKAALCILALALVVGVVGCASSGPKSHFKQANIQTVAIAPVTGPVPIESARMQIASIFADNLRSKGYQVVSIGAPGTTGPSTLNVPPNTAGTLPAASTETLEGTNLPPVTASTAVADATMNISVSKWTEDVAMDSTLVDNRTGRIVWTARDSGKTDKLWKSAGGSTQPAAIGAVVSGPGGYVLSPKDEYVVRHVAENIFATLPNAR